MPGVSLDTDRSFHAHQLDYTLTDVEVELTNPENGATMHWRFAALDIREGRRLMWSGEQDVGRLDGCSLTYFFEFSNPNPVEPEGGIVAPERSVVIRGTHPNGHRLEIEGDGWVWADTDSMQIDGMLDDPPEISVPTGLTDDDSEGETAQD